MFFSFKVMLTKEVSLQMSCSLIWHTVGDLQQCLFKKQNTVGLKTHLPPLTSVHFLFPCDCCLFQNESVWNDFLAVTIVGSRPSKERFDALSYISLSIPFLTMSALVVQIRYYQKKKSWTNERPVTLSLIFFLKKL